MATLLELGKETRSKPSDFANANIEEIVEKLTADEAISLTAGVGFWHTAQIPRLDIPAIKARTPVYTVT